MRFSFAVARALAVLSLVVAACSAGAGASPSPGNPTPSPGQTFTAGDLRLALIDRFGPRWYCDPDLFPVAHGDEQTNAIQRFDEVRKDSVLFPAILRHLRLDPAMAFGPAEKLAIYGIWKVAVSIPLDPIGNGRYRFEYLAQPAAGGGQGTRSTGTIDETGAIVVEKQAPAGQPPCPICLARGTPIDAPAGAIPVDSLRIGDVVWSLDAAGRRVPAEVIALGSTPAPAGHRVVHLVLEDGRWVTASPGHPLADGRKLGSIAIGDTVDRSRVVSAESIAYDGGRTFDLVVSGPTGIYLAGGVPLGSTIGPSR